MSLYESFQNPSSEFRQAPFWFWNHRLDRKTLDWQIDQMAEKGIGGFVMHARHGLITPYLSDEWFECIRFCCEKARTLGMVAWAYDERDWPSGPAGGEVIADRANRLSYLKIEIGEIQGPFVVELNADVVCAYAAPAGEALCRVNDRSLNLPAGAWIVAKAIRIECPAILWFESYLDTLNPAACDAFIRSTYDRHVEKLGDLKALGLSGFFTDEPALSTYPDDLARIPWTPSLPGVFREMKGYDLLEVLPDLFRANDAGAQIRYDYWDVAVTMFERAFFKAIEDWCVAHGVELIGHALGEEPLFFQFRCVGNLLYLLKHFHRPGLDHLTIHVGKGNPGGMSPKIVESAALLAGRERTMTETFGESGWGLTLREMKWMADWQMANGINYIIPHAFYYSVAQRRKKDSPPSEFFQAPFWPYYRQFADYTARVTAAMTGGEHIAKVAVLYPMSSVWAEFVPGAEVPAIVHEMEQAFAPLGEFLLQGHHDFVIVDEQSFAGAQIDGKAFIVNGLRFEALVIPVMSAIREDALATLRRIAASCCVVAVQDDTLRVLRTQGGGATAPVNLADIPGLRMAARNWGAALADITPDVIIENAPDVYCLHRRKEGKDLHFLANTSRDSVDTIISLETVGRAETWDPETGGTSETPGQRVRDGRLEFPLHLAAMGSALIVVDPAQPVAHAPVIAFEAARRIAIDPPWHFIPENGNFLILKKWNLVTHNQHHVTELHYSTHFVTADHIANMRLILDGVPGRAFNVHDAARPILAHETDAVVRLDDQVVTEELPWEIDTKFRVLSLKGLCRPSTHALEIIIKNNGWFPQPGLEEYAWLAGDFHLDALGGLPCLVPVKGIQAGSWEDQGYPYFSGTGAYYADITISGDVMGRRVFLEAGRVGDLLVVEVNGRNAGVRAWPPYRVEITPFLCPGPNLFVLKVTNSARNFFEGPDKNNPSGLLEVPRLEIEGA